MQGGITPKKIGNLVRYQFLWNDILRKADFNMLDAVCQYGYTDQSHLMREFKRYHGMDIQMAKQYAYHVGNIQYSNSSMLYNICEHIEASGSAGDICRMCANYDETK